MRRVCSFRLKLQNEFGHVVVGAQWKMKTICGVWGSVRHDRCTVSIGALTIRIGI